MSAGARCANSFHRLRRSPSLEEGGLWGGKIESWRNVGGRAMRAPTTWRKTATVRCIYNAGLHHCNGWMHLQPSVTPQYTVGARIARPFVFRWYAIFQEGARRVLGATAKPLYAIDGKAGGLDRRNPQTSLLEGGGPPAGGGRSKPNHMPDMRRVRRAYDFFCFRRIGVGRPNRPSGGNMARKAVFRHE